MKDNEVIVQRGWLEELLKLANECKEVIDKTDYKDIYSLHQVTSRASNLAGYASSAEFILKKK